MNPETNKFNKDDFGPHTLGQPAMDRIAPKDGSLSERPWERLDPYSLAARLKKYPRRKTEQECFLRFSSPNSVRKFLTISTPSEGDINYPLSVIAALSVRGDKIVVFWSTPDEDVIATLHRGATYKLSR